MNGVTTGAPWDCEYTDPDDNSYFSGTCATQQEIDDAWATALALQEDVDAMQTETDADYASVCASHPEMCEEPYDEEVVVTEASLRQNAIANVIANYNNSSLLVPRGIRSRGSLISATSPPSCADNSAADEANYQVFSRYSSAIAYASSIAGFGLKIWRISSLLSAAPPVSGIGFEIGAAVLLAAGVAGSAIALHDCLHPH